MIYVILDGFGVVKTVLEPVPGVEVPSGALAVVNVGSRPWTGAIGQIGIPVAVRLDELHRKMQAGVLLVDRPESPAAFETVNGFSVPPCPAGTEIEVFGRGHNDEWGERLGGVIVADQDGFTLDVQLTDPGIYTVEIAAPAPALPSERRFIK